MTAPHRRHTRPALLGRVRRRCSRLAGAPDGERGDVTIWAIMFISAALLLAVLLVDGGAKMQAHAQAAWYAAEAARAAVNATGPRPDHPPADDAATAARTYLTAVGITGTVTVQDPDHVQVSATVTTTGPISGATFTATRTATAALLVGVETGAER